MIIDKNHELISEIFKSIDSKNISAEELLAHLKKRKELKDIEDKKIVLRGCFVSDDNPEFLCNACKYEWKKEKSGEKICKICEDVVIFCKCYEDVIEDILGE